MHVLPAQIRKEQAYRPDTSPFDYDILDNGIQPCTDPVILILWKYDRSSIVACIKGFEDVGHVVGPVAIWYHGAARE